jgi:hypothetical protein
MKEKENLEAHKIGEGFDAAKLVTKPLPTCDQCGAKATVLILEDGEDGLLSATITRCDDHLGGGYDIDLYGEDSLTEQLANWLDHLEGKGGTKAFVTVMNWLQTPEGRAIIAETAHGKPKPKKAK